MFGADFLWPSRLSCRAGDVVATLERVCAEVGFPKTIRVDQREPSSFPAISTAGPTCLARCSTFRGPASRRDNAFIEAFNGKLPQECLAAPWVLTLADVREKMEAWRRLYNEDPPTAPSATRSRSRGLNQAARPARRHDEARTFQPRAAQGSGSAPKPEVFRSMLP